MAAIRGGGGSYERGTPVMVEEALEAGWFHARPFGGQSNVILPGFFSGGVPREQKRLKGHLPRVIYHQVYFSIRRETWAIITKS